MPEDPYRLRLSGSGGQGLILAGIIVAEAAVLDGKNVVQTQSYGPEARLGASRSEVIISQRRIAGLEVIEPDLLLCLSQDSFDKYSPQVRGETVVVIDS
ncbi:MAG: 2-oxoacid:ferredoxin oxidoreductase subunit gamma, partial [Thermoplasmata archaeon]|nr:2-oxoacid:ferredoxin oxidoreductase subunit gamma [Thermoplasmata archaeon]NIY04542.1 2-oxoacid:ferredoxin oxidoreductase subunit gamma [Thermoplasmata archaeon]